MIYKSHDNHVILSNIKRMETTEYSEWRSPSHKWKLPNIPNGAFRHVISQRWLNTYIFANEKVNVENDFFFNKSGQLNTPIVCYLRQI